MAISDLITEIRTEISDDNSTRFTDAQILRVLQKAIRRANRIAQRNGLQFAKKLAELTTTANQAYLTLSSSITDFDVLIGMWRTDLHQKIKLRTEEEWESIVSASVLEYAYFDYANDKIRFKDTPSGATTIDCWYYPTVTSSSYTTGASSPWGGRLDDIIMEYTGNRLKNIDEMDLTLDTQLMTDFENQILQAYAANANTQAEGKGWTGL